MIPVDIKFVTGSGVTESVTVYLLPDPNSFYLALGLTIKELFGKTNIGLNLEPSTFI